MKSSLSAILFLLLALQLWAEPTKGEWLTWESRVSISHSQSMKGADLILEGDTWFDHQEDAVFMDGYANLNDSAMKQVQKVWKEKSFFRIDTRVSGDPENSEGVFLEIESQGLSIQLNNKTWSLKIHGSSHTLGACTGAPQSLSLALQSGTWTAVLDGKAITGKMQASSESRFTFAVGSSEERSWQGTLHRLSYLDQLPKASWQEAHQQLSLVTQTSPAPEAILVEAELVDAIRDTDDAYPRVLVNYLYKLVSVQQGQVKDEILQVYHWGRMGHASVDSILDREIGQTYRLKLLPLESIPFLGEIERTDHDDYDFQRQDFFDASL